jgi:hypothetical protein
MVRCFYCLSQVDIENEYVEDQTEKFYYCLEEVYSLAHGDIDTACWLYVLTTVMSYKENNYAYSNTYAGRVQKQEIEKRLSEG